MSKILTFKNDRSYFTVENIDLSSISFFALREWAMSHCTLDKSSSEDVFILVDDNNQTRLKGCRLYAIKKELQVSPITEFMVP